MHVAALAARQHGAVTTSQLAASGIGARAIAHRVATGRLRRLHRGVYLVGPLMGTHTDAMAALLACGPEAVLSDGWAATAWALPCEPGPCVDVTVASGQPRPRPGIRIHRRPLERHEITTRHGLRITRPARTLLDLATVLEPASYERVVEEAQVLRLASRRQLEALLERRPRAIGARALRAALAAYDEPSLTRSGAERRLLALIRRARLPKPLTNVKIGRHEVDFHWPEHRLVLEVDGYAFHSSRRAFEHDRLRDAELQAAGQRVMRATWRHIDREPEALLVRIAGALAAGP
jgi:very-short-patch-repair endonuclease